MSAMTPLRKTKAKDSRFETAVILGAGYSARLAAIALDQCCEIAAIVGQPYAREPDVCPKNLQGQRAHSHIFLPRLEQEMQRIDPTLLPEMADLGFRFVPGSNRLPVTAPDEAKRLFATRWQFDSVIETLFKSRVSPPFVDTAVTGMETAKGRIQTIALASGDTMEIEPKTLVVDAMGAQSPIMKDLGTDATGLIDEPGDVAYITQFFRTTTGTHDGLPDPLIDCPHQFGPVRVLLYPGADGWFSVSRRVSRRPCSVCPPQEAAPLHGALQRQPRGGAMAGQCHACRPSAGFHQSAQPVECPAVPDGRGAGKLCCRGRCADVDVADPGGELFILGNTHPNCPGSSLRRHAGFSDCVRAGDRKGTAPVLRKGAGGSATRRRTSPLRRLSRKPLVQKNQTSVKINSGP